MLRPCMASRADPGAGHGKVGHAEVLRPVVGIAVLGRQGIALVLVVVDRHRRAALHVAEAGVLEEVPPEGVARIAGGLVAGGDPGAPLDQVVPGIEGRGGEIVVPGMDLEAVEGVDRGLGPLPDIAEHVEEIAGPEPVDRAG